MEVRNLSSAMMPEAWAKAYRVSADTFSKYYQEEHVRPNNDCFRVLGILVRTG